MLESLTVDNIRSQRKTNFSKSLPTYDLKLVLGGDMERYVWHINGKSINEDRTIQIRQGDVVRFTYVNETMMHHPMHLHGHFFRVLNSFGEYSPLKHTVDVPPHGTRTIEFIADEPGEWMLHCHNLYHMKNGMARVVKYSSYTPKPEIAKLQKHDPHMHEHIYYTGMLQAQTNYAQARFSLLRTWDTLEAKFETTKYNSEHHEGEILYHRWFSNYLNLIAGGTYYADFEEDKTRAALGVGYVLPLLIESNLLIDHKGQLRLGLEKRFQWTQFLFTDLDIIFREHKKVDLKTSLMYANSWNWSAGFLFTDEELGIGFAYKF